MYSVDKIQRGVARFVETELMPKMDGKDKWIFAGISTLALNKLPQYVKKYSEKEAVKLAGIMTADAVDVEAVIAAIKPAAHQTPAAFKIPFGGVITLTESDLDTILEEIKNA